MSLIVWLVISVIVYITAFKDDFTKEHIDKAMPFIITVSFILLLFGTLLSIAGGRG